VWIIYVSEILYFTFSPQCRIKSGIAKLIKFWTDTWTKIIYPYSTLHVGRAALISMNVSVSCLTACM